MPRREPVATARFEKTTPVAADSIDAVTTAFNTSLGEVIRQVVDWTLERGQRGGEGQLRRDGFAPRPAAEGWAFEQESIAFNPY